MPPFLASTVDEIVWEWVEHTLLDPEALAKGIKLMYERNEQEQLQLEEQRTFLAQQLAEIEEQLERILDLYLAKAFDEGLLAKRQSELQHARAAVKQELAALDRQLSQTAPPEEVIESLQAFAATVRQGLQALDFTSKQRVIELLDVNVTLTVEDGQQVSYVTTALPNTGPVDLRPFPVQQPICRLSIR